MEITVNYINPETNGQATKKFDSQVDYLNWREREEEFTPNFYENNIVKVKWNAVRG